MQKQKIVIANWKMRLGLAESVALAQAYVAQVKTETVEVAACASEIALTGVGEVLKQSHIKLGAQNVFWEEKGEYTGEVSAKTLAEAGCSFVIVGHSERRMHMLENYEMIHQKLKAVLDHTNMAPVLCVGETQREKEAGRTDYVILDQLQQSLGGIELLANRHLIVAYEPIWAIGSGHAIGPADVNNMHEIIHASLVDLFGVDAAKKQVRVIYGGSVNAGNVKSFGSIDNVDGFLVGTASMDATEFAQIVNALK
jgi:triosephosphate isomerase